MTKHNLLIIFTLLLGAVAATSCNKDDIIEDTQGHAPVITLDSDDGIYTVKTGRQLTISPDVDYADGAVYSWTSDGVSLGDGPSLTVCYDSPRDVYVTFGVENKYGSASEEIKIEVLEATPPVISLALPEGGLKVLPGTEYTFTPDIQHADEPGFTIEWIRDGKVVCTDTTYTFCEQATGTYPVTIKAANDDGTTTKDFTVEVVASLPCSVSFPSPSYFQTGTDRSTVAGRPVYLTPRLVNIDNPAFTWSVDGKVVLGADARTFIFTPSAAGDYTVTVTVSGGDYALSATVTVHCYDREDTHMRTSGSLAVANRVYEYLPAPGQFINDPLTGGFTTDITTLDEANKYALNRLDNKLIVSLGGWGGYIIVGFDHSIANSGGDYDFAIQGNAFNSNNGNSNEPGIVYVMQDTNGNGLPDDEWYELRGSLTGAAGTIQDYWCTYYRPDAPGMDVNWTDSEGVSGKISYLRIHLQDYYYPLWMSAGSYTLYGTRLPANNTQDAATGLWSNNALDWGYADNIGSDNIGSGNTAGDGQTNGFKISNAMYPDGTPVNLSHIDFIKVQTGVNAQSGPIGENSCEVCSFRDLSAN